jgi:hypothetical protein
MWTANTRMNKWRHWLYKNTRYKESLCSCTCKTGTQMQYGTQKGEQQEQEAQLHHISSFKKIVPYPLLLVLYELFAFHNCFDYKWPQSTWDLVTKLLICPIKFPAYQTSSIVLLLTCWGLLAQDWLPEKTPIFRFLWWWCLRTSDTLWCMLTQG